MAPPTSAVPIMRGTLSAKTPVRHVRRATPTSAEREGGEEAMGFGVRLADQKYYKKRWRRKERGRSLCEDTKGRKATLCVPAVLRLWRPRLFKLSRTSVKSKTLATRWTSFFTSATTQVVVEGRVVFGHLNFTFLVLIAASSTLSIPSHPVPSHPPLSLPSIPSIPSIPSLPSPLRPPLRPAISMAP